MIVFSIVIYIVLSTWYLLGNDKSQRISTILGVCISSFFSYWYWDVDNIAMIIYIAIGLVSVFFHWIAVDSSSKGKEKNKIVAAIFALFLGGYGIHRFYLRKSTSGLLYVLFCWSLVPGILGIVEAIRLFVMPQDKFHLKYNINANPNSKHEPKTPNEFQRQVNSNTPPMSENYESEENLFEGVNERDGDNLNYRDIRLCGYKAEAVGSIENFAITVKSNGKLYTFKTKGGDICSYRSSTMRETKHYEVT